MVSDRKRNLAKRGDSSNSNLLKLFNKVAKYLRFSTPSKKGLLAGMKVDYFVGSVAVDILMESQWTEVKENVKKGQTVLFRNRADCIEYFQALIDRNMIHRSFKMYKPRHDSEEKRKYKLEVHEHQTFIDSEDDLYVWVYEPATLKQYVLGSLVVIIVIACCLFPLWPVKIRALAVYGSMGSAGFLGLLLALALIKYILFVIIWLFTRGHTHFWLLPNLSEDVGFFESFVPAYEIKYPKDKKKKRNLRKDQSPPVLERIDEESTNSRENSDVEDKSIENKNDEGFELLSASELDNEF